MHIPYPAAVCSIRMGIIEELDGKSLLSLPLEARKNVLDATTAFKTVTCLNATLAHTREMDMTTERPMNVCVLVGSLQKASLNGMLANALISLAPSSMGSEFVEIGNCLFTIKTLRG